jgi:hypothetical protein
MREGGPAVKVVAGGNVILPEEAVVAYGPTHAIAELVDGPDMPSGINRVSSQHCQRSVRSSTLG